MFNKELIASHDVDCQKGFTPICPNELPVPDGDKIVDALNEQAKYARVRTGSKDAHCREAIWIATPEYPQFTPVEGDNANVDVYWNKHCIVGSKGFELLDGLPEPINYDYFVFKGIEPDLHPYGSCYHDLAETRSTGLVEFYNADGIETIIVGGLALDYCCKITSLQLKNAGFNTILNLEACRGVAKETSEKALLEMSKVGIILISKTEELKNYIE